MWIERLSWQEGKSRSQRQWLCNSRNIWEMWKMHDRQPQSLKQHSRRCWMLSETVWVVLAMGPGNLPAVRVWTRTTVWFGSGTYQKPVTQLLGGANPDPYPSTRGFCQVWLDPSVPISGFSFRVFLCMVAFWYPTVLCKILSLVHHCLYLFYWLPL